LAAGSQECPFGKYGSQFPTEADAIADVLLRRDIPKDAIALKRLASDTSENFWLAGEALRLESYAATGLIDLGEPVPVGILSAAINARPCAQAAAFSASGAIAWGVSAERQHVRRLESLR
jgi:hypothetical protein